MKRATADTDTRMVTTALHASESGGKDVVVVGNDRDLIVTLIARVSE